MTVAALIAAALGGGIVASLLDSWFRNLRDYETARVVIAAELDAIAVISNALRAAASTAEELTDEPMTYPTSGWLTNRGLLAIRAARWDPAFLRRVSGFFTLIESFPPGKKPLGGQTMEELHQLRNGIVGAQLGVLGEAVIYGPRAALSRRDRRRVAREKWAATGAQTGAQEE